MIMQTKFGSSFYTGFHNSLKKTIIRTLKTDKQCDNYITLWLVLRVCALHITCATSFVLKWKGTHVVYLLTCVAHCSYLVAKYIQHTFLITPKLKRNKNNFVFFFQIIRYFGQFYVNPLRGFLRWEPRDSFDWFLWCL